MSRPKSFYVSAFDKISEGLKALTGRVLRLIGEKADEGWDNVRTNKDGLADRIAELIAESVRVTVNPAPQQVILHHLFEGEEIVIGATDGKMTMAQANDVFNGYLDPDFKNWGTDKPGRATKPTKAAIYEVRQDATFNQMFGSLGDLNKLVWEQSQIVKFCTEHRNKLRQEGYASFFLFKVDGEIFVAYVRVRAGKLRAFVRHFGYDGVWYADCRHRVVVPQL